jgi:hypothetical protein
VARVERAAVPWRDATRALAGLLFGEGPSRVPISGEARAFTDALIIASYTPTRLGKDAAANAA